VAAPLNVVLDADAPWARRLADGWSLTIRVQPGASRSAVVGPHGVALRIRVAARAVDGKANAELVRFLAEQLGVPARDVEITRGHAHRTKVVHVSVVSIDGTGG
jgi:uncharacterized protein (TIGR00251 family)